MGGELDRQQAARTVEQTRVQYFLINFCCFFVPVKRSPNPPELTKQMKKLIKYIVRYVDE